MQTGTAPQIAHLANCIEVCTKVGAASPPLSLFVAAIANQRYAITLFNFVQVTCSMPGQPSSANHTAQVCAGESPEAKMRLRSGHTKIHNSGRPADPDVANTRRSSRRQAAAALQRIDDSEDDEDERPATKRQLVLPAAQQVSCRREW